ncbi:MAG: hypothetical protein EPO21_15100 [Chloroflexota bacterium]|nr:MAG: hypothetical protein EPO21_15100 [Chloroflexota bacterium]
MYWSNFLHIYQPPTQTAEIVAKVTREAYRPLTRVLEQSPRAKLTLNISACLTEQLARYGFADVIESLGRLAERGQIEFTGSAMYHPILPLIPCDEAARQIELNTRVNRRYFGDLYNPRGFFPPEMCYSFDVASLARSLGFAWILADEICYNGSLGQVVADRVYEIEGLTGFCIFFKERPISTGLTFGSYPHAEQFLPAAQIQVQPQGYLLTGTDGEIYGHHRPGQELLLQEIYSSGVLKTCTVSELLERYPERERVRPVEGSWSSWEDEIAQRVPYAQWRYPGNGLHALQWELTQLVTAIVDSAHPDGDGYAEARMMLDRGLHSCQYWWASCRPWWDTEMIERGARELAGAALQLRSQTDGTRTRQVERLLALIRKMAYHWQSSGRAMRLKKQYMDEHREVANELTFGNPPHETQTDQPDFA